MTQPEEIDAVLARVFQMPAGSPTCAACRQVVRDVDDVGVCRECVDAQTAAQRLQAESREVLDQLELCVTRWLGRRGVGPRELTARSADMPDWIVAALEPVGEAVDSMRRGRAPHGFGLAGPNGCGKSFALSSLLRDMAAARFTALAPKQGLECLRAGWLVWLQWPWKVNDLRAISMRDQGVQEAREHIARLAEVEVLVLDDLGVERMRGPYAEDWTASLLDELVDMRYNAMKPTWYTTNLRAEELQERYGARLVSRLCGGNPLVWVRGKDLRL